MQLALQVSQNAIGSGTCSWSRAEDDNKGGSEDEKSGDDVEDKGTEEDVGGEEGERRQLTKRTKAQ